ncbi:MAG: CHAD domain-containing protein [Pirellulales bacterium]|nr:CHAD domain-containing protein [Pirellulales bacterium]
MAFRIRPDDGLKDGLIGSVRRIAREEIEAAIGEIADSSMAAESVIHQVRKRTKRIRALLRLIGPGMPERAKVESTCFKDAAKRFSSRRDADVCSKTLAKLKSRMRRRLSKEACTRIRHAIKQTAEKQARPSGDEHPAQRLREFRQVIECARDRLSDWNFSTAVANERDANVACHTGNTASNNGASMQERILFAGLERTYRAGRKRMKDAIANVKNENVPEEQLASSFHAWRKQVKNLGYHAQLLWEFSRQRMQRLRKQAEQLGELLGDDHDLSVLGQFLCAVPHDLVTAQEKHVVRAILKKQSARLRKHALQIGRDLYAKQPHDFLTWLAKKWRT